MAARTNTGAETRLWEWGGLLWRTQQNVLVTDAEDPLSNRRVIKKPRFLMRGDLCTGQLQCGRSKSFDSFASLIQPLDSGRI